MILLADPNLMPSEREALERLLAPTVAEQAPTPPDAAEANVERTAGIVGGQEGQHD